MLPTFPSLVVSTCLMMSSSLALPGLSPSLTVSAFSSSSVMNLTFHFIGFYINDKLEAVLLPVSISINEFKSLHGVILHHVEELSELHAPLTINVNLEQRSVVGTRDNLSRTSLNISTS